MLCRSCNASIRKFGKTKTGDQRYQCVVCKTISTDSPKKVVRLERSKVLLVVNLLVEGNSIRSTERITGVKRDTILRLLNVIGERCEKVMTEHIKDIKMGPVEADEIWGYVKKKEGHKKLEEKSDTKLGDAYTFVAIDGATKLVAAYQLGRRDIETATKFMHKLFRAAGSRIQLTTDGLAAYVDAVEKVFGADIDFAQLIKSYKSDNAGAGSSAERRYSPGDFQGAKKTPVMGSPDPKLISTSYVERQNLTMRMSMRRLTRLTNAFSKKWDNLNSALVLHFAYYNFCRIHSSLRVTPAMEAGVTNHLWSLDELIGELP